MPKTFIPLMALLFLKACGARDGNLWAAYLPPAEHSFRATGGESCPQVGVQNLSPAQAETIVGVVRQVCGIFAGERFARAVVAKRDWLVSCETMGGGPDAIAGERVLALMRGPKADFSVVARQPGRAIAKAEMRNRRMAIRGRWFDYWPGGTAAERAELIRTVAHEMAHFTSIGFPDQGHGSAACPDARLASYEVGEIAARIWLEQQGAAWRS